MKFSLGLLFLLGLSCLSRATYVSQDPVPPWRDEDAIKAWIVLTVEAAPPAGGTITVLKHWKPHYAKNDKIGEIWIVPSLCNVEMSADNKDHEMQFCVFHVDTGKSEVMVSWGVPDGELPKYLKDDTVNKTGI
jgi:hypothetical protein